MSSNGSPPHTRGILFFCSFAVGMPRITPAHAGNTSSICKRPSTPWDHPRTRGEYCVNAIVEIIKAGSPPHTRGIPEGIATIDVELGITPAHAGNTAMNNGDVTKARDHPRTRGEYYTPSKDGSRPMGSPPHTRGIQLGGVHQPKPGGITPAHAGNTAAGSAAAAAAGDHPRTRGEY